MGMHRSQGATALGHGRVRGRSAGEVDGELLLMVETTPDGVGCDGCGTRAVGHGRREVKVRDLPIGDRRVVLMWRKRLWRCPEPDCPVKTWAEDTDAIAPRAALTERARAEIWNSRAASLAALKEATDSSRARSTRIIPELHALVLCLSGLGGCREPFRRPSTCRPGRGSLMTIRPFALKWGP